MRPKHLGTMWIEGASGPWGNVYDKPYYPGSGKARRIIGRWIMLNQWLHGKTPMASFWFDLGSVSGYGKRRTDYDGAVNVWAHKEY